MGDRRDFLKQGLALGGLLALHPGPTLAAVAAPAPVNGRLLVIFIRGGLDGLHAFAPVYDPRLASLRPTLATKVQAEGVRLGKTGFAVHPSCAPLAELFSVGELSFAPCAGTTDSSRSHFQAQDLFELGSGAIHGGTGFLARAAEAMGGGLGTISFTREVPLALRGGEHAPEVVPLTGGGLKIPPGRLREAILAAHQGSRTGEALETAIATEAEVQSAMGMEPMSGRGSPGAAGFVKSAGLIGRLLRNNPRLALAFVEVGGVDTHAGQEAALNIALQGLSTGLKILRETLGVDEWRRTRVLAMSEFGRTARENGTKGTDHGHGGLALVAGGGMAGGRMLGDFPGLGENDLHDGRDLPVLIDWRDLLGELMKSRLGFDRTQLNRVFPGRPGQVWAV